MSKRYIKDDKIYDLPIILSENNTIIYTNNEQKIIENGYVEYIVPEMLDELEKSESELIAESDAIINKETDNKILNNFSWNGEDFYLTMENQTNFANMYMIKDKLQYPQTIKTKTGYAQLNSAEEVESFYLSGVMFVKTCLEEGWESKTIAAEAIKLTCLPHASVSVPEGLPTKIIVSGVESISGVYIANKLSNNKSVTYSMEDKVLPRIQFKSYLENGSAFKSFTQTERESTYQIRLIAPNLSWWEQRSWTNGLTTITFDRTSKKSLAIPTIEFIFD